MIELRHVSKTFTDSEGSAIEAVRDVSLRIEGGGTLCLIGSSGCGKTTTLRMINRLVEPTSGTILVDGRDVTAQDVIALRRRIGYVIQRGGLFPHMSVFDNIALLCRLERWPPGKVRERVEHLLNLVNLPPGEYSGRYPGDLSGGQRQRVGVARALALDPDYILMDEPFGALDPITRDQLHGEFLQLKENVHKTIVMVTHDLREAFKLGDRVALMDEGALVQEGTEEEFRERPATPFVDEFMKSHLDGGSPS